MVKSEPVVALLLACNWILVTGNGRPDIKIEGALQRYKMSKSFKCGHPVQFYVMHCTCDCHKDTADLKYYEHPRYNEILCKGSSHFCFPVPSKTNHLEINGDDCEAYGICLLRLTLIHTYNHALLTKPKNFNVIKLNGSDENILVPSKYSSLVVNKMKMKINCLNETANQPGWYFWLNNEPNVLFKSKNRQTNRRKEVNFDKNCWFQLGNKKAVVNKIISLDPLTNEVCNGNESGLKFGSVKGLYPIGSVPDDDALRGIKVEARKVNFFDEVVEFSDDCKNEKVEYDPHFISLVEGVHRIDEDVYLKINLDVERVESKVAVAVWDLSGQEIMPETTVVLEKFLLLCKNYSNFGRNEVLVCSEENQSTNWCEIFVVSNASESELQEYHKFFFPISSMTTPDILKEKEIDTAMRLTTATEILKNKTTEAVSDLINVTLHHHDLGENTTKDTRFQEALFIEPSLELSLEKIVLVIGGCLLVVIMLDLIRKIKRKRKNILFYFKKILKR